MVTGRLGLRNARCERRIQLGVASELPNLAPAGLIVPPRAPG